VLLRSRRVYRAMMNGKVTTVWYCFAAVRAFADTYIGTATESTPLRIAGRSRRVECAGCGACGPPLNLRSRRSATPRSAGRGVRCINGPRQIRQPHQLRTVRPLLIPLFLLLAASVAGAEAAPRRIELGPATSEVDIRAYALGLLPLDGRFVHFHGWFVYDPDDRSVCQVDLNVEVASLAMSDAPTRDTVIGPDFMDAAQFPSLAFTGACQPQGIGGTLGLHGVTRPFSLSLSWAPNRVVAEGELHRADWGMTAMPIFAGPTVRIVVSAPLPGSSRASRD
jgi:polyisoprenoid-binding protein YceI